MTNEFRPNVEFTAGAQRALRMAGLCAAGRNGGEVSSQAVLMGLLSQSECRAAAMLGRCGVTPVDVAARWPELRPVDDGELGDNGAAAELGVALSAEMQSSVDSAAEWLAQRMLSPELASEHLLWGLVCVPCEVGQWLGDRGLTAEVVEQELCRLYGHLLPGEDAGENDPIGEPIDLEDGGEQYEEPTPPRDAAAAGQAAYHSGGRLDQSGVLRVIDAASNRAREGVRVVEDFVRFVLNDVHLTEQFKQLRHDLSAAVEPIAGELRLAARETQADVGTDVSTEDEHYRDRPATVLAANFCRVQESLRTLEEFLKLIDSRLAVAIESLRYRSYTLERAVHIAGASRERLATARLYVLLDGQASEEDFQIVARELVLSGVDVLQLRDKGLDDRALLARARLLREITQGSDTLFAVNDRPDVALLARADAVHVGQEELSVGDVRALVGPGMLIGVSVHSADQARAAVLDGADYLGVGPTFASETKSFDEYPGLALLEAVAAEISLPAFAIGGIGRDNLPQVLATGMSRVAVSSAVVGTENPAAAASVLKGMLR